MQNDNCLRWGAAWAALETPFQRCLELAWASLINRGLPVGAVVTSAGVVIGEGRNRVYDAPGGADALQGSPIAHAEMNAIAAVTETVELGACEIWSTHEPCSMCQAAIDFVEVRAVHHLSGDPSSHPFDGPLRSSGRSEKTWVVMANVLFVHNVIAIGGAENSIVVAARDQEPETTEIAVRLVSDRTWEAAACDRLSFAAAGAGIWDVICEAVDLRSRRLGGA